MPFNNPLNSAAPSTSSSTNNPQNDMEVVNPPQDSISGLAFSPAADLLAVSSWDSSVRVYQVSAQTGQSEGKTLYNHDAPALSVCWSKDGSKVFSGGGDNAARMLDIQTGQSVQVAAHEAAVKCVKWVDLQGGLLATGSWDKTMKYWDIRTPNPIATLSLPEKVYCMDARDQFMVVATAERHVLMYNLNNPTAVYRKIVSPLRMQTRSIACFPTADGFAIGSIEGRLGVQWANEKRSSDNYSFKCHRQDETQGRQTSTNVYAVNDIAFNDAYGTFSTAGADGVIAFWDGAAKIRLRSWDASPGPISATAFNRASTLFAYAVSYDWSKGHGGMTSGLPNQIRLHACKDDEMKRKPRK